MIRKYIMKGVTSMCKIEFIKTLTYLEDSAMNTENFLSLLQDKEKIKRLEKFYIKVKELNKYLDLNILPSYNIYSKNKKEKNLEVVYLNINEKNINEIISKYNIIKEKNQLMLIV